MGDRGSLRQGRPRFEECGAELVADVAPYELMKLRLLNGSHSTLSYLGYLAGYETVSDVMADRAFADLVRALMDDEVTPTLAIPPARISRAINAPCSSASPTRRSSTAPGRSRWMGRRNCRSGSLAPSATA